MEGNRDVAAGRYFLRLANRRIQQNLLALKDNDDEATTQAANTAPVIGNQPANQIAFSNATVALAVTALGSPPLGYQWRFNGTNLPNATGATLNLSELTANQGGPYTVLVSNAFGSVLSSNAVVTVLPANSQLITFDELPGGGFCGHLLGSRCDYRKDLHIDTRVVHDPQSLLVDVRQFRGERFSSHRGRPHLVDEIGGKHMFFKGDLSHGSPSHRESVLSGAFGPYHRASAPAMSSTLTPINTARQPYSRHTC